TEASHHRVGAHSIPAGGIVAASQPLRSPHAHPAEIPHASSLDRPGGHHRGGAGRDLPRPRHGRGARGCGRAAAPGPDSVGAAVGGGEHALLQLVRPAVPEGLERLPLLRPTDGAARPLTMIAVGRAMALAAAGVALAAGTAGCGGGGPSRPNDTSGAPRLTVPN